MEVLNSKRLIFSKFQKEDYSLYHELSSNEKVMRYITGYALTEQITKKQFQKILKINNGKDIQGVFKVTESKSGKFVGLSKSTIFSEEEVEIGYVIMPEFWGNGYGSEMSSMMIDFSKQIKQAKILIGIIDPENEASKRILEKSGFSFSEEKVIDDLPGAIYKRTL